MRNEQKEYRELARLTAEARKMGIDPTKSGWMGKLAQAKRRETKAVRV